MHVVILGPNGAVGKELQELLKKRKFPLSSLHLFSSQDTPVFEGVDLAFFCVSKEKAKKWIPIAIKHGVVCIDASTAFRKSAPLIIPEINKEKIAEHQGILSSPNCTTTLLLMALYPLHKRFSLKKVICSTYQAVSGAGAKGVEELERQTVDPNHPPQVFPTPCAFNVFPHEAAFEEEEKMQTETQIILGDSSISVRATCVRVPVKRVHSISVYALFEKEVEEPQECLNSFPGVFFQENVSALDGAKQEGIIVGRVQKDPTDAKALELWVVGDQLLKGAALNMVQIAEELSKVSSSPLVG